MSARGTLGRIATGVPVGTALSDVVSALEVVVGLTPPVRGSRVAIVAVRETAAPRTWLEREALKVTLFAAATRPYRLPAQAVPFHNIQSHLPNWQLVRST